MPICEERILTGPTLGVHEGMVGICVTRSEAEGFFSVLVFGFTCKHSFTLKEEQSVFDCNGES